MDAVQKANAGHPGTAMALAPLAYLLYTEAMRAQPATRVADRDRFVLSAGHACVLQYSRSTSAGYDLSLEDLKQFRQWGSRSRPVIPSAGHTAGHRGDDRPARPGFRERRRHGDRRALPRRALQPARATRSSTTTSTRSAPTAT
jgi:transketolase